MNKLWVFFVFVFMGATLLASIFDGSGGIGSTVLTSDLDATSTTISVDSTEDFLDASVSYPGYGKVNTEIFTYTSKTSTSFTSVTRGVSDPQTGETTYATIHDSGDYVVTLAVDALDTFMGYQVTTSTATFGFVDGMKFIGRIFTNLPKMISWDYNFLDGGLSYLKYLVLYPMSAGLVLTLIIAFVSLIQGIFLR